MSCGSPEELIDDIHASHPGTWGMICMATHCLWPYMIFELIVRATECKPCTVIGKNLKYVIPAKRFRPHVPCVEQNQEIQIDFGGSVSDEKVYFLVAIGRFLNTPLYVFVTMYIDNHGIPRSISLLTSLILCPELFIFILSLFPAS